MLKKIFSTTAVQLLGKFFSVILGIYLARSLGPSDYGEYSYLLSLIIIFSLPVVSGLSQLIIREIAKEGSDNYVEKFSLYILFTGGIISSAILIALIYSDLVHVSNVVWIVPIVVMIFVRGIINRDASILNGNGFVGISQVPGIVLFPLINLLLLIFIGMYGLRSDVSNFLCVYITSGVLCILIGSVLKRNRVQKKALKFSFINFDVFKTFLVRLLPLSAINIISVLNVELVYFLLRNFGGETADIGIYRVAHQIIAIVSIFIIGLNVALSPMISNLYNRNQISKLQDNLKRGVRVTTFICAPIFFILFSFSKEITNMLFGVDYESASYLVKILLLGQVFNVICGPSGLVLNMTNNEFLVIRALILSLVINVLGVVIIYPTFGLIGVAVVYTLGMLLWNIMLSYSLYRKTSLISWVQ